MKILKYRCVFSRYQISEIHKEKRKQLKKQRREEEKKLEQERKEREEKRRRCEFSRD